MAGPPPNGDDPAMQPLANIVLACLALAAEPGDKPLERLLKELSDPKAETRLAAAEGIAERGQEARAAVPALVKVLKDADEKVRAKAVYALKSMGDDAKEA